MPETDSSRSIVLGGGGHASVLIDCLLAAGVAPPVGILDAAPTLRGRNVLGVPVLGGDDLLEELAREAVDAFLVGVGSTKDAGIRRKLFARGLSHGLRPLTVRHPSAIVSRFAQVAPGAQLLPGCILNTGATVAENAIVNSGAIVEHDCRIGAHAHIAPRACLAGEVQVGEGAHIGAGAVIRQGLAVGAGAIVGAGSVVVKPVPEGAVVIGVPARPM